MECNSTPDHQRAVTVHNWFNRIWYQRAAPPAWLVPLSLLYALVTGIRRTLFRAGLRRTTRLACAVIVVGNVSVGGTGKTPLVLWLVESLSQRGLKPGIVTRGYGGASEGPRLLAATDAAQWVGDEAVLLSRRSGVPVAAGRRRTQAAQLLLAAGCDVIVSDDGLQHYALARDCEIGVVDGGRRFGNGRLLPAGPLREPQARLNLADAVVQNGGEPCVGMLQMHVRGTQAVALLGGSQRPLADFFGKRVHALAGIGNPPRFFDLLRSFGMDVVEHALADHAQLTEADIRFADDLPVLMTEKDAVKCLAFAGPRHWFVPVSAEFKPSDAHALMAIVERKIQRRAGAAQGVHG